MLKWNYFYGGVVLKWNEFNTGLVPDSEKWFEIIQNNFKWFKIIGID